MTGASLPDSPGLRSTRQAGDGAGALRRILAPVDAFGRPARALTLAAQVSRAVGGELRVVRIRTFDPPVRGCGRFYAESATEATAVIDQAVTAAWGFGCKASGVVVDAERSRTARVICSTAAEWSAQMIVLARRPWRVIGVMLLGSVADQVMRQARCPVLVVRPDKP